MLKMKSILLSLSALTLIACTSQEEGNADGGQADSQVANVSLASNFETGKAPEVENLDDGSQDEEDNTSSEEIESAVEENSESNNGKAEAEEVSLNEPADGKDMEIIEFVKLKDSSIPEDAQFYIGQVSETEYQIEVRQDGADASVSNLIGLYQYQSDRDELLKQDPSTGEFVAL